jgi:outer membrane protein OmpA-like peptidoglycan-associated protein
MKKLALLPLVAALGLSGCATDATQSGTEGEHDRAVAGAIVGGIIGGIIANNTGNRSAGRTAVGVLGGAAVGGAVGNEMDKKEARIRQISAERDAREMEVERLREDLLRDSVSSEASFDFDRAELKPEFKPTLDKVAAVLRDDPNVRITIIGFTDSVGTEEYNQRLSERRARATADYLISRGVSSSQIVAKGLGESEPRADNSTAAGRAQNRRVEIYLQQV